MNRILIVANWKMNPGSSKEAWDLAEGIKMGVAGVQGVKVVLCPPFVFVPQILPSENVEIGGQDCFWEDQGAFTGEVSPMMLKNLGCSYVILGHSERKSHLGETSEMISRKIKAALAAGLIPVACVGAAIEQEMRVALSGMTKEEAKNLILVYEPEWAISTNNGAAAANPEDCKQAIELMRKIAVEMFGDIQIPILYGGSTNNKNVRGFIESGAQGALVGSASLDAKEFVQLVRNAVVN